MLDNPITPRDTDDGRLQRPAPPRTWRDRIEGLADATGSSPGRILAGAVLAAAGVAVALWIMRPPAAPPEASLPFASTTVASALPSGTSTEPEELVIHVAGAVVSPGIHRLPPGARVVDAIAAAGGVTPAADAARINLAAPVADGERVYVLTAGEASPPPVAGGAAPSGAGSAAAIGPVNLNTADASALEALPGVGPATAAAILEHRRKVGAFTSVEQLLDVPGIGDAKLEALRGLVTV